MDEFGLIEAYWGPQWDESTRESVLKILSDLNLKRYIYGPKACRDLRQDWTSGLSDALLENLTRLRLLCRSLDIEFGVMISPSDFTELSKLELQCGIKKAGERLALVRPDLLTVAFDDMPREVLKVPDLQVEIAEELFRSSACNQKMFCPTTYSTEKVVQAIEEGYSNYMPRVSGALGESVRVLWTGKRTVNKALSRQDIEYASQLTGRKPSIWWNFPANDGHGYEDLLRLSPVTGGLSEVSHSVESVCFNPMNEGYLSAISITAALDFLRGRRGTSSQALERAVALRLSPELGNLFMRDVDVFEKVGRAKLSPTKKDQLRERYRSAENSPYIAELLHWLSSRDDRGERR